MNWKWLRLYTDITSNQKIRRLPIAHRWIYITILVMGRKSPEPGTLLIGEGDSLSLIATADDIADEAKAEKDEVEGAVKNLIKLNILNMRDDGALVIRNFNDKQYPSDSSATRTRKWREKQATKPKKENEISCDVTVTSRKRHGDGADTDTDTETDTEKEEEGMGENTPSTSPLDASFSERKTLTTLLKVDSYPFDSKVDLDYIREWSALFPYVDIAEEIGKWRTYLSTAKKQPKNLRLALRNWLKKANQWAQERGAGSEREAVKAKESGKDPERNVFNWFNSLMSLYFLGSPGKPDEDLLKSWYDAFKGEMLGRSESDQRDLYVQLKKECRNARNEGRSFINLLEVHADAVVK